MNKSALLTNKRRFLFWVFCTECSHDARFSFLKDKWMCSDFTILGSSDVFKFLFWRKLQVLTCQNPPTQNNVLCWFTERWSHAYTGLVCWIETGLFKKPLFSDFGRVEEGRRRYIRGYLYCHYHGPDWIFGWGLIAVEFGPFCAAAYVRPIVQTREIFQNKPSHLQRLRAVSTCAQSKQNTGLSSRLWPVYAGNGKKNQFKKEHCQQVMMTDFQTGNFSELLFKASADKESIDMDWGER